MNERATKRAVPVEDEVVASIAHDLGNLLAAIDTCADVAARGDGGDLALAENLSDIRAAARRGTDLVVRLRRVGRVPAADPESDAGAVIGALVPTLMTLVGPEVRVEAQPTAPGLVARVDAWQLERALCHVVAGARARGATRIVLSAGRVARRPARAEPGARGAIIRIVVEDDATAAAHDDVAIATAQRIVTAAGGQAWARTGPSKAGACAFLELPAH